MFSSLLLFSSLLISMKIWACLSHGFKIFLRCIYLYVMCTGFCLYVCESHSATGGQRRALVTPSSDHLLEGLSPFAGDPCQVTQSWQKCVVGLCSPSFPFNLVYSEVNWNLSNHRSWSISLSPVTVLQVKPIANQKCWLLPPHGEDAHPALLPDKLRITFMGLFYLSGRF